MLCIKKITPFYRLESKGVVSYVQELLIIALFFFAGVDTAGQIKRTETYKACD